MGAEKQRKARIEWMKAICQRAQAEGKDIDPVKLCAQFAYKFGSTERKAREILELLQNAGEI